MKNKSILIFIILSATVLSVNAQSLSWDFLIPGDNNENCTSDTDCESNTQCYGLMYTPSVSGTMTSYTLGFLGTCSENDQPYLDSNSGSCTMNDKSSYFSDCDNSGAFLLIASGNTGNMDITAGIPVMLHQICFTVNPTESINITEDDITQLTVSVDSLNNDVPLNEYLQFLPVDINSTSCDNLCGGTSDCTLNFNKGGNLIIEDTLSNGDIVNASLQENLVLLNQYFDVYNELTEDCSESGGEADIGIEFSILHTEDINNNGVASLLGGGMNRLYQSEEGIIGEIAFNTDLASNSSTGDVRTYQIEVVFADHLSIIADQLSVDLGGMNSSSEVFESAIITFLDESLEAYHTSAYEGYFTETLDLSGNCNAVEPDTGPYKSLGSGAYAFQDILVVDVSNPCNVVMGINGSKDDLLLSARTHAGLDSSSVVRGFKLIVKGEDVSTPDELDDGSGLPPDDGIPGNSTSNASTVLSSVLKGIEIKGCVFPEASLAVDWKSLKAEKHPLSGALLSWSTVTDDFSDYFEIEWKTEEGEFIPLQSIVINSRQHELDYSYVHESPSKGSNYYRVKKYSFDGTYTTSNIASLFWDKGAKELSFNIYPNPTQDMVYISCGGRDNEKNVTLSCSSITGSEIFSMRIDQNKIHKIDLTHLDRGMYIICIKKGELSTSKRLMKF